MVGQEENLFGDAKGESMAIYRSEWARSRFKIKKSKLAVFALASTAIGGQVVWAEDVLDIPSAAAPYNVSKGILLAADSTQGKPDSATSADIPASAVRIETPTVNVRAQRFKQIGPMPGLSLTREEIPGNVQSITAKEIKEAHAVSLTDLMNSHLQSVNVNDYQSNPFQMDVTYRGFTASPQLGTAQGLSVFLDGIRVNEPFGDVVNWDMIPLNALSGLDVVPGSNPIFGLGTLGGALSMKTKSGFDNPGVDAEVLTGSFGRKQLNVSGGWNNGAGALFGAASLFDEDGWRKDSPSKVNQLFGKAEWRGDKLQLGLSTLYAGNDLVGNGLLPKEVADQDPSKVFTSPDETKNRLMQFQLSGQWDVSESFNVTGQVYRRNSKRKSLTTDVNEQFGGLSTRRPNPGEKVTPGFADVNHDGLPDYYLTNANVASDANGLPLDTNGVSMFVDDGTGNFIVNPASNGTPLVGTDALTQASPNQLMFSPDGVTTVPFWTTANPFDPGTFNGALPSKYYQFALNAWNNRHLVGNLAMYNDPRFGAGNPVCGGCVANMYDTNTIILNGGGFGADQNYTDAQGFVHYLRIATAIQTAWLIDTSSVDQRIAKSMILPWIDPATGLPTKIYRNGADAQSSGPFLGGPVKTGFIDGTPTALITNTTIDQISDGGALQLNWNLDKHKLMMGASVDMADASYQSSQMLGLLDANHKGYLAPANIGAEYAAATTPIGLNDFKGDSITKSFYASETWTPVDPLHITAAARYNHTRVNNTLAVNNSLGLKSANAFLNFLEPAVLCPTNDPASCPDVQMVPFSVAGLQQLGLLGKPETEKFTYHSFNPALGATWQANEALNLYGNWNRGARTPSVIELGCAFDATPIYRGTDPSTGKPVYSPRSMYERRFCSLPSTMSGDPYLKQVQSETIEFGARGTWGADMEWNATAYRTSLQDDIYFVSFAPDRSFFQNIGDTRRQGVELGFKGKVGKASFRVNYGLTDATFQSSFSMASPNNSSASSNMLDTSIKYDQIKYGMLQNNYQQIQVNPGNRMPGVPLHNLNASFYYDLTDRWKVGLTAIVHSSAFVRGNENNQHHAGPATPIHTIVQCNPGDPGYTGGYCPVDIPRPDFRYDGKTNGYAVFNFQTSYKLAKEWTLSLIVNNIFDKTYYSAGRLGINPFSPTGPNGGIVSPVTGFNYNSNDWLATNFLAPGAPRAAWVSLSYEFDPEKK